MAVVSILNEVNSKTGLPIHANFTVPSNASAQQILMVTGSGFASQTNVAIGVQVVIEGNTVGEMYLFSNGANTHRAFAPVLIPLGLTPGQTGVTLTLQDDEGTPIVTDSNDWFSAALFA